MLNPAASTALSVNSGVVSALNASVNPTAAGFQSIPPLTDLIRTDAAINHGNSGGPMVDGQGRLVGVNTLTFEGISQNENYALGVDRVKTVLSTLETGHGLGWVGFGLVWPDAEGAAALAEYFQLRELPEGIVQQYAERRNQT